MKTIVVENYYKNVPMFTIANTGPDGEVLPFKKPVVNFGITKAEAILNHIHELEKFVEKNGKGS